MRVYRPKVKAVVAIQFDTNDIESAEAFALEDFDHDREDSAVMSQPGPSWRVVEHGDWIVRYPNGQFRIYLKDEFLQFFEPVEGGAVS